MQYPPGIFDFQFFCKSMSWDSPFSSFNIINFINYRHFIATIKSISIIIFVFTINIIIQHEGFSQLLDVVLH